MRGADPDPPEQPYPKAHTCLGTLPSTNGVAHHLQKDIKQTLQVHWASIVLWMKLNTR